MSNYSEVIRREAVTPYLNLLCIFVCGVLLLLFILTGVSASIDDTGLSKLYLLMLVQLAPFLFTMSQGKFNYISFVLLNHFVVYSLAKYNLITNIQKATKISAETRLAFEEMTYCTILITAAYLFVRILVLPKQPLGRSFDFLHINPRAYFYLGVGVVLQPMIALIMPNSLVTLHTTINAICLVVIYCSTCNNLTLERWVKLGIILAAIQSFAQFGSLSIMGTIGSIFGIVALIQKKTQNFIILAFLLLVGLLLQGVKQEFRLLSRQNDDQMSLAERVRILPDLLMWKYFGDASGSPTVIASLQDEDINYGDAMFESPNGTTVEDPEVADTLAKSFTRVGDDSLERVLSMTPSQVPFWNGESYINIVYFFIPRFLWPGKPSRDLWNKFGRMYGFLSPDDMTTSVGVNFLGEAYMNFGFGGLYTIAILFGIMLAGMESLSNVFLGKPNFFAFMVFIAPFMNYGLDFGSIFNSVVLMIVIVAMLRYRLVRMVNHDVYA